MPGIVPRGSSAVSLWITTAINGGRNRLLTWRKCSSEIVDIWHFGMSALFREGVTVETLADEIIVALDGHRVSEAGVLESTEALAEYCLRSKGFSVPLFWDLMTAAELSFDDLYKQYVGKNVLNFFRQDHGYKDG